MNTKTHKCARLLWAMFEFGSNLAEIMSYIAFTQRLISFYLYKLFEHSWIMIQQKWYYTKQNKLTKKRKNKNMSIYGPMLALIITLCCPVVQAKSNVRKITHIVREHLLKNWFQLIVNRTSNHKHRWWIIIMDMSSCGEKKKINY